MHADIKRTILDESGLTITTCDITASGRCFQWTDVASAHLEIKRLVSKLLKPTFILVLKINNDPTALPFFETHDAGLAYRIELALTCIPHISYQSKFEPS